MTTEQEKFLNAWENHIKEFSRLGWTKPEYVSSEDWKKMILRAQNQMRKVVSLAVPFS